MRRFVLVLLIGLSWPMAGFGQSTDLAPAAAATSWSWLEQIISRHGMVVGSLAVFLSGLALNLTPCVYPMIPVTLAFFGSQSAGRLQRAAWLAFVYVVGISLNYAVLGLVAARTGKLLGSWLQHPVVLVGIATTMFGLSLGMLGVYELRVPQVITRSLGQASAGTWGAFVMGLVVGLVAAPCIGPFVLGLMLFVGRLANPAQGFWLFFVLGLGMGVPYIALGMLANQTSRLPKAGPWLVWTKKMLGLTLWAVALLIVRPLLPLWVLGLSATALLIGAGLYLGWLERSPAASAMFRGVRWSVGVSLIAGAIALMWPRPDAAASVAWQPYSQAAFERAVQDGQPVVVDVYADWCLPCVEMDHVTFRQPDVIDAMRQLTTLRIDATKDVSSEAQTFLDRYKIYGVPTVMLFQSGGHEREDLRLTGFESPERFLKRLREVVPPKE